ncbi:hypothetical protein AQUCO_00200976v1 [Aquilegia coerulea]|uniref:DNA topoisomerase n=1 Tax=Aquilegia coerulea TaxID=218851 RepID=A0A2G5F5Q6_AQUCA|nr:hypothetical protein AQUCO_00200976v1 [Aquilegia coerulea]
MGFQLHRFFVSTNLHRKLSTSSSSSSRLPTTMLHCRTLQNYPSTCLQLVPFSNGGKFSKSAQLRFRKSGDTCDGQLKSHRVKVERDSCLVRSSLGDNRLSYAVTFPTTLRLPFSFPMKFSNSSSYSRLESNKRLKFASEERFGRRFFSVKASESSQVEQKTMKISGNNTTVGDVNGGVNNSPVKLSDRFRKLGKSSVTRSSSSDREVAVSSQAVEKGASVASKSVRKTAPKPKNGKKDVKLKSTSPTSPKSGGTNQKPEAQVEKKQLGNKKEKALSGTTTPLGEAKINGSKQDSHTKKNNVTKIDGSKQVARTKKDNVTKVNGSKQASHTKANMTESAGEPSQASQIAGETPLSTLDNSNLLHEKSKTTVGKPTSKKKPHRKVTVHMKPDKAPAKPKINPVPVEVKKMPLKKGLRSLYPPTGKSVVVVESLTKAKVIQGYLGNMYEVLPSYGHVRDLAGRSGSVRPDDDFSMVWEVPSAAWTHLKSIKVALNGAENLILASDPDREGEAIAWHITEMLQQQDALPDDINVSRVVFHEITESSIKSALQAPRNIDADLVHAYLARRALDYLIGFSISPLLWRKLPACQSAGRVQSAALALICDREMEIDEFKPQEYWTVDVGFNKNEPGSSTKVYSFPSHLTHLAFKKLEQLSISCSEEANAIEQKMTSSTFEVLTAKRSKSRRNPPTPYITSTLQQDAASKLNFTASYTMKLAQKLYEGVKLANEEATGLITYMRTDGLHVSDAAANDIHSLVIERYGKDFASESIRKYFKKVKNAQEAHEAIRPTSIRRLPSMLTGVLDEDSLKLYALIWSRAMACQMVPTIIDQIQVDIGGAGNFFGLRSVCSRVEFYGFQAVYKDAEAAAIGYNEKEGDAREEAFEVLCKLKTGDSLHLSKVELKQHSTQPPSRYSEASLVKKLEELGIGRPSTYASTIKVLQDRHYVTVKNRALHPEFRGRMVSAFLSHHFSEVTDYSFTADMETELDNVSAGTTEWKGLLKDYWTRFKSYCDLAGKVDIRQVEKMLEKTFGNFIFASLPNQSRTCPSCSTGTLVFKVSRFGAGYFIGCDQHPECKYIARRISGEDDTTDDDIPEKIEFGSEPKELGLHPVSNEKILLKHGPYGFYIQHGEDRRGHSPKRASVSQIKDVSAISLEDALDLLQYPVLLGNHPDDGVPVYIKIASRGFSIRHRRTIAPVPKNLNPKKITLEKALKLLLSKDAKQCGRPKGKIKSQEAVEAT